MKPMPRDPKTRSDKLRVPLLICKELTKLTFSADGPEIAAIQLSQAKIHDAGIVLSLVQLRVVLAHLPARVTGMMILHLQSSLKHMRLSLRRASRPMFVRYEETNDSRRDSHAIFGNSWIPLKPSDISV